MSRPPCADLVLFPWSRSALAIVGVPMALPTAHMLSGLAYIWIAFAGWYSFSRLLGGLMSGLFVLPTTTVLLVGPASLNPPDFLALGTELLPVSIIILGSLVLLAPGSRPTLQSLAVASALAGIAIWAKPQVIFLAGALGLVGLLIRCLEPDRQVAGDEPRGGSEETGWWREPIWSPRPLGRPASCFC